MIDCEDLSLNVSREILQHDRQVKAIRNFAIKKTLDEIERLRKDKPDVMLNVWREFGAVMKEVIQRLPSPPNTRREAAVPPFRRSEVKSSRTSRKTRPSNWPLASATLTPSSPGLEKVK